MMVLHEQQCQQKAYIERGTGSHPCIAAAAEWVEVKTFMLVGLVFQAAVERLCGGVAVVRKRVGGTYIWGTRDGASSAASRYREAVLRGGGGSGK